PETLGAPHGEFGPAARVRDLDQTVDHLGILTRGGESVSEITECRNAVRKIEPMSVLHESIAYRLRYGPLIGVRAILIRRRSGDPGRLRRGSLLGNLGGRRWSAALGGRGRSDRLLPEASARVNRVHERGAAIALR